jgi:hypothetical protein
MDMDSDDSGDEGSYDGHLEDTADSGKNNTSSTLYSIPTTTIASARHVSSNLHWCLQNPEYPSSMTTTKNVARIPA